MLERALARSVTVTALAVDRLQPGTVIVVDTQNSRYRLVILLEPRAVLVTGGSMFPEPTVVRFVGSSVGASGLKDGWILVGSQVEMWRDPVRITLSIVRSVSIERVPPIWPPQRGRRARTGGRGPH
jgi:hypothetical protein